MSPIPLSPSIAHIYDNDAKKLSIDKLLNGPDAHIWSQGVSNEMGRLTKGNDAGSSVDRYHGVHHKTGGAQKQEGHLLKFCLRCKTLQKGKASS